MTRHVKQELAFGGNQSQLQALPAATVNLPAINGKRESGPTTIPARSLDALSEARFQQSEWRARYWGTWEGRSESMRFCFPIGGS